MAATGDTLDLLEFDETTGKRAVYEEFEFEHRGGGEVLVRNASHGDEDGHEHTVYVAGDIPTDCTCPAFEYHCGPGEACKHCVAVALHWHEIREDAVDRGLGAPVDG